MAQSLAERLGFGAQDRVAIVHADDIGMCHDANVGAFEALRNGPATCGSLMVPCPWFAEAAAWAREEPDLDLGVHLTLNSEFSHYRWGPVAGRDAVPSLLDDEGYLPRTSFEVARQARPEEVEVELRAQVEHALAAGIDVTHLDAHMGTAFFPSFIEIYRKLASDYRLPAFAARPDDEILAAVGLAGAGDMLRAAVEAFRAVGLPVLDGFDADSLSFAEGEGESHNRTRLGRLVSGLNYLICHPARGGAELWSITQESAHQRDFERSFYGGQPGRAALQDLGVQILGMRPLRDLLRS